MEKMKKYELTTNTIKYNGRTLYQIKALMNFGIISAGELGGYIESEKNLSQEGNAWVIDNAKVSDNARVSGNAKVSGNAWVIDNACVIGNACVSDNAWVSNDAKVSDNARVSGNAWVSGNARVSDDASVSDARVSGNAWVRHDARVSRNADYTIIKGFGTEYRNTTFFRCKDGNVRVTCGCFCGTVEEFREQVKRTRTGKIAEEYLMIADLMEFHFREENANDM